MLKSRSIFSNVGILITILTIATFFYLIYVKPSYYSYTFVISERHRLLRGDQEKVNILPMETYLPMIDLYQVEV